MNFYKCCKLRTNWGSFLILFWPEITSLKAECTVEVDVEGEGSAQAKIILPQVKVLLKHLIEGIGTVC